MMMREYTQAEIDEILSHDEIIDKEHAEKVNDISLLFWIDERTTHSLNVDLEKLNHLYSQSWKLKSREDIDRSLSLRKALDFLHLTQGIQNFDYERHIWRVAYTLKSVQLSEQEDRNGEGITSPTDLIKNFTSEDFKSFQETYEKLKRICANSYSGVAYIRLLQDKIGLKALELLTEKYSLDIELSDVMKEEAINTHSKILLNLTGSKPTNTNKTLEFTLETEGFKPLLDIPDLREYTLPEEKFIDLKSDYEELSLQELLDNMTQILSTFRGVIMDG